MACSTTVSCAIIVLSESPLPDDASAGKQHVDKVVNCNGDLAVDEHADQQGRKQKVLRFLRCPVRAEFGQLGIDQPYLVQLGMFVQQIATFDFGLSWSTGEPVSRIIATRLGPSLTVLSPLTILDTLLGIALALAVARVAGSLTDRLAGYRGPAWPVGEVLLLESRLGSGPSYERHQAYSIGAAL